MRRVAGLVVLALGAALLAACGPAPRALDGIEVLVYQPRTDIAVGRLAVQVANGSDADLEVVALRLTSPGFVADVAWDGDGTTVAVGRALDLRAPLPVFACDAADSPVVVVDYRDGDTTRTARLVPDDPYDLLDRLRAEQCLGERIAAIVVVTPREVRIPSPGEPAILVFDVAPTGAPGTVVLDAVDGTTLLQPAVDGVAVRDVLPLGLELLADGPREFELPLVPNRCDAHALADDKVGTIIPFLVTVGSTREARWTIPAGQRLAGDLTGYYAAACGLSSG